MKIILNKKAQISVTLTWIVAFIIIFFVILLLLSATLYLVGSRKAGVSSGFFGLGAGTIQDDSYASLRIEESLIALLNSPVSGAQSDSLKKIILQGKKENIDLIVNSFKDYISSLNLQSGCALIHGESFGVNQLDVRYKTAYTDGSPYLDSIVKNKGETLVLSNGVKSTQVSYYFGAC